MQHCVVGFEFTGDPVLQGRFLPFRDGLTVLYGLNGAGKTRLADGIRAALTGVKLDVDVSMVVRLHEPTELDRNHDNSWNNQAPPGAGLLLAVAEVFAMGTDFETSPANRRFLEVDRASQVVDRWIRRQFDARSASADLRDEVAEDRLFLMHPAGTSTEPAWDVWPVANSTGQHVKHALSQLKSADDQIEALEYADESMDAFHDVYWSTPLRGQHAEQLLTRARRKFDSPTFVPYSSEESPFELFPGFPVQGPIDLGLDVLPAHGDPNEDTVNYIGEITILAAANAGLWDYSDKSSPRDSVRYALTTGQAVENARGTVEDQVRTLSTGNDGTEGADSLFTMTGLVDRLAGEVALELEMRASESIAQMMIDAPTPVLQLTPTITRFSRPAARWLFRRAGGGQMLSLENLSRAERVWAGAAVNEALYWHRREHTSRPGDELRPVVTILDEPESGLHRSAEAHTARALVEAARDPRNVVVAATHSPELLDAGEARIIEVKRGGGTGGASLIRELDLGDRAALGELGLMPSDLLRWPRVFLLVEGAHDEALLDAFFGDRLRAARVQILPLRGATKLPGTIESRVLFEFTSAHLVALVDNQDPQQISEAWTNALKNRASGTLESATSGLADAIQGSEEEARFLREWLTTALRRGVENRITPYSLRAKDIIEYVPVSALLGTSASWPDLRGEHATAVAARNGVPKDFKRWIEGQYGIEITPDLLRNAARDPSPVPDEMELLMKTLEAVAHR